MFLPSVRLLGLSRSPLCTRNSQMKYPNEEFNKIRGAMERKIFYLTGSKQVR
jgi:hypothetical protein